MNRRCKPGQRARFVRGWNQGKVVVVVRAHHGGLYGDCLWPQPVFPWVVTSLGLPLRIVDLDTGQEKPGVMSMVACDRDLEPLQDDDDGMTIYTQEPLVAEV